MRTVVFKTTARRQWAKLPQQLQQRIAAKIEVLAQTGQGDVIKLKGQDGSRLRVGDYRIIFYQESDNIVVAAVGHRRDIYVEVRYEGQVQTDARRRGRDRTSRRVQAPQGAVRRS